jgi:hypothetical protein
MLRCRFMHALSVGIYRMDPCASLLAIATRSAVDSELTASTHQAEEQAQRATEAS